MSDPGDEQEIQQDNPYEGSRVHEQDDDNDNDDWNDAA